MTRLPDPAWQQRVVQLESYPCATCHAEPGQTCTITMIKGRTKPENVGKPQPMPHAARHRAWEHDPQRPPKPTPAPPPAAPYTPSPQVRRAIELLERTRDELATHLAQVEAALRYLTRP